ncbi:DNA repair protein RadC [Oscillospiraceae bacterium PP1C4]
MPSIHEGHRQRLKDRFLKRGLDDFEPHNVLELLLFYAVPQRDTNDLAHRLLKHFGSLSAVFDANFDDLCKVDGVGKNTATLIKMIPDLFRRYQDDYNKEGVVLTDIAQMGEFLRPKFIGRTKEHIFLLCLDNKGSVVYADFIIEGTINSAPLYTRNILEIAMRCQATSAILAHNHPKGLAIPSNADLISTRSVYDALEVAKIKLIDHFIFAGSDYTSLRNSGFFTFR